MTSPWKGLEQIVDGIVDEQFAELVEFYPWSGGQHVADEGALDPTRSILRTTAIYVTPGAAATGEGGTLATGMARFQSANEWVSITRDKLGDPANWVMYDRVYFPERDPEQQWHSISEIVPSATDRYNVMLIRLKVDV